MAIAWVLRKGLITSALIGASQASQVRECAAAIENREFSSAELVEIDKYARDMNINLWNASSENSGSA